jgi:C4-type Zn-finger protein
MPRTIIPKEQIRPSRLYCPKCDKHRMFDAETGVITNPFLGRIIQMKCRVCGYFGLVEG